MVVAVMNNSILRESPDVSGRGGVIGKNKIDKVSMSGGVTGENKRSGSRTDS